MLIIFLLEAVKENVSTRTVGRRLAEVGISPFIAPQKDNLSKRHKQLRLQFALTYTNQPIDYWKM